MGTSTDEQSVLVSIVIPAREWDAFLEGTLASVACQVLGPDVDVEVIVALGGVAPDTVPNGVRVVANPTGTIPDGLNLAIAASAGDVVIRVDARCVVQPDHVARVLARLDDAEIGCIGGAALTLDRGLFGSAYAVAFNSPLLGPTIYRYRRTSGTADAAYLGAWRRTDLDALGGFDSRMIRNQDNELADRVRASGKTVWYDADLVVGYFNARDFASALAHHHEFGLWRMVQRQQGQRAFTSRHVAAVGAAALMAGAGGAVFAGRRTRPFAVVGAATVYAAAGAYAWRSARLLRRARPDIDGPDFHPLAPVLAPAVATAVNGAWLAGVARGAWRHSRGRSPRS